MWIYGSRFIPFAWKLKSTSIDDENKNIQLINRWELPLGDSKIYWDTVCKDIESRVSMTVKKPSFSHPFTYPITSPSSTPSSTASSVDHNDSNVDIKNSVISQPITKVMEIASSCADLMTATELSSRNVTVQPTLVESTGDQSDQIFSSIFDLTKLSKMTKLVNNFLSNIRPRVVQCSSVKPKKISSRTKIEGKNRSFEFTLMTEKSFDQRSTDVHSPIGSLARNMASVEGSTAETAIFGNAIPNRKTVIFHDALGERIKEEFHREDEMISVTQPRRARAPSLSIASAVPSFGKVVISIEDIDSMENPEKHEKPLSLRNDTTLTDYRAKNEPDDYDNCNGQTTQDFLQVPQVRSAGHASYPIYDDSKYEELKNSNEMRFTDETYESKLLRETRAFEKKYKFWPKRSIVNVFRAVKTMRTGLRTKARIESETNRFFAAPIEIYSPSARSSISSDNQMDFAGSNVQASTSDQDDDEIMEEKDYDGNEWRGKVDKESNASSYTSVRKRLMRNAVAHLSKDSQHDAAGTCIDISNAPEVTFEQADPSSFYSSWATSKNEVMEKRRNKKTLGKHFIGIPRLNRIFPRVKTDKCFACMCKSLGDIHQPYPKKKVRKLWNDDINDGFVLVDKKLSSETFDIDSPAAALLDQFYKHRYQDSLMTDKTRATEDHPANVAMSNTSEDQVSSENLLSSKPQQSVINPTKNTSQIDDLHRSRALVKSPSKTLVTAHKLITSLMSDRTRSISDQDDSDQGLVEFTENENGAVGGPTMKNLAPCHMPINLKPSLEPLKALKNKKSRSIRSRVASAEKSGDSADDDETISDFEDNIGRQSLNVVRKKLDAMSSPRSEMSRKIDEHADREAPDSREAHHHPIKSISNTEEIETDDVNQNGNIRTDSNNDLPIISDYDVIEISKKCLANGITTVEILQILANEYSNRLNSRHFHENCSPKSLNARDNEKKAINLITLLAESKSYLNRAKRPNNPPDLLFSSKQPSLCNARQLRRILPLKSYNIVAPILGMAKWYPRKATTLREAAKKVARLEPLEMSEDEFDLIVHPPSRLEQNVSFEKNRQDDRPKLNPYSLFLIKPRRKAVTWRPLTEQDLEGYDPEATLKKRVAKITNKICEDFCQWLESLAAGTNQTSGIDVEVLKDMFETDLTAEVCSTMQMCIKEMPMIPTAVAIARNCPGSTDLALTRKHLAKDARAEMRPKKIVGFGAPLPIQERFKTPQNQVKEKWLQCENVPEDLETMDAVWKGITHLESVKVFTEWLKVHPEVKRPKGLEKLLSSKKAFGPSKSVIHDFKDQELDLDQIQSLKVADNAEDVY